MKIKGKEYGLLTSNRALAELEVLKRKTNFDLNCGGVYGGISSVRRDLFDYRGYSRLSKLIHDYNEYIMGLFSVPMQQRIIFWKRTFLSPLVPREVQLQKYTMHSDFVLVSKNIG